MAEPGHFHGNTLRYSMKHSGFWENLGLYWKIGSEYCILSIIICTELAVSVNRTEKGFSVLLVKQLKNIEYLDESWKMILRVVPEILWKLLYLNYLQA